ncbi:MAG: aldolase/citrate lyase family protein [Mesorhizobium sp.]
MKPLIENRSKKKLAANELVLCMGVNQMRTPDVAMIAAACDFDAIYIDLEHSPTTMESASAMCIAAAGCGVTPIARAQSHDAHHLTLLLDIGAQGLMVPHVETADEARAIVSACRYPPLGKRSVPAPGPSLAYRARSQGEDNALVNGNVLVIAMIESAQAVENMEEIAAVEGIDAIHFGTHDLSADLGVDGQFKHPKMLDAFERGLRAAKAHGKSAGVGGIWSDPDYQALLVQKGFRYLTLGADVTLLMAAASRETARARAIKLG